MPSIHTPICQAMTPPEPQQQTRALSAADAPFLRQEALQLSNRQSIRLDTALTRYKQKTKAISNRQKTGISNRGHFYPEQNRDLSPAPPIISTRNIETSRNRRNSQRTNNGDHFYPEQNHDLSPAPPIISTRNIETGRNRRNSQKTSNRSHFYPEQNHDLNPAPPIISTRNIETSRNRRNSQKTNNGGHFYPEQNHGLSPKRLVAPPSRRHPTSTTAATRNNVGGSRLSHPYRKASP